MSRPAHLRLKKVVPTLRDTTVKKRGIGEWGTRNTKEKELKGPTNQAAFGRLFQRLF